MVGSGYIAVELAGILNALGSDVSIVVRYNKPRSHCRSHRLDRFVMGLEKLNFELSSRVGLICSPSMHDYLTHVSRTLNRSLLVMCSRYITQTNVQCLPGTATLIVHYPHYQHSLSTVYCCYWHVASFPGSSGKSLGTRLMVMYVTLS